MKTRYLELAPGAVTDVTPERLLDAGWRPVRLSPYCTLWSDPRTGREYAISQAEAIRRDRATPRYRFEQPRR